MSEFNNVVQDWVNAENKLKDYLKGRKARYICPSFNGQSYGRSRKPLTGKEFTIKGVSAQHGDISVWDGDYNHCYADIERIELLPDER